MINWQKFTNVNLWQAPLSYSEVCILRLFSESRHQTLSSSFWRSLVENTDMLHPLNLYSLHISWASLTFSAQIRESKKITFHPLCLSTRNETLKIFDDIYTCCLWFMLTFYVGESKIYSICVKKVHWYSANVQPDSLTVWARLAHIL